MMSRACAYGYDQRIELFGTKGSLSVENQHKTSTLLRNGNGIQRDCLKYSFPERFQEAFAKEVNTFAQVACFGEVWPISMFDCINVQSAVHAAAKSYKDSTPGVPNIVRRTFEEKLPLCIRQIGKGEFGSYIYKLISSRSRSQATERYFQLPPYSRTSSRHLDWNEDVIGSVLTRAFYICSPDAMHQTHAIECLSAGKHVLVEKPVTPCFDDVMRTAIDMSEKMQKDLVVMVGFHRRFDAQFKKAKAHICELDEVRSVCIKSFDPVPAESDLEFVVQNSMCHDLDMLYFLWPKAKDIIIDEVTINDVTKSSISIQGKVIVLSQSQPIKFTIIYTKMHPKYVQTVSIENIDGSRKEFGYNSDEAQNGTPFFSIYNNAYINQYDAFCRLCEENEGSSAVGSNGNINLDRMRGYSRTFQLLKVASDWVCKLQTIT